MEPSTRPWARRAGPAKPGPTPTHWYGGSFDLLNGDIAEVIVYNWALSPNERSRVQNYLAQKYGRNLPQSDFQHAGYYAHQPSGLNLTMYRAYDPNTARWLSRDPRGEAEGISLYQFVQNDSINQIDPTGLWSEYSGVGYGTMGRAVEGLMNHFNAFFYASRLVKSPIPFVPDQEVITVCSMGINKFNISTIVATGKEFDKEFGETEVEIGGFIGVEANSDGSNSVIIIGGADVGPGSGGFGSYTPAGAIISVGPYVNANIGNASFAGGIGL
jgi:RHS repeat-associated protein